MTGSDAPHFVHATALVIGEQGILIEGASGSGKSSLAAALLRHGTGANLFASLVCDDRVGLMVLHGRIIARHHPAVAGLIEHRGIGLQPVDSEPACVLDLIVRLFGADHAVPLRLPDEPPTCNVLGTTLPLLLLPAAATATDNAWRVIEALARR